MAAVTRSVAAARKPRPAALAVLVIAALATVATSPPPPTEATRAISYSETIELSAATPTAVRRLAIRLDADADPIGLQARLIAQLEGAFDPAAVRLSIIPNEPGNQDPVTMPNRSSSEPGTLFFTYRDPNAESCDRLPCARSYDAIVELQATPGNEADIPVPVTLRVGGGVTVSDETEVPAAVRFDIDPVGELQHLPQAPEVTAASEPMDVEIGGPDRLGSEIHALVVLAPDTLPLTPAWPVVPEVVLWVVAQESDLRSGPPPQLSVTHQDPYGNRLRNAGSTYFYPAELPVAVSRQNLGGCEADSECTIPVDAYLGAQNPGDLVGVRWWVEVRVRYFETGAVPERASARVEVVDPTARRAEVLAQCAQNPLPVLFLAVQQGLIDEDQLFDAQYRVREEALEALVQLDSYEQLCRAALASLD